MEPSSFSGSSKRAKAPGNIAQVAHCLVDGCDADLSLCRDYHRRHKVCEIHSKTSKVTIGDREQRFCQQCSRFHSLVEFDEGKRSCRKRLDGHNRRRRKPPQADPLIARNSSILSGLVFSTHQTPTATRLVSFSNPQMLPSSSSSNSSWPGIIVKPEEEEEHHHHHHHHHDMPLYNTTTTTTQHLNYMVDRPNAFPAESSSSSQGRINNHHLQLVPQGNIGSTAAPHHHPHPRLLQQEPNSMSGRNSDRALSLLSSVPPTITREFHLNHHMVVQTDAPVLPPPPTQPLAHNLHFGGGGGGGLDRYSPVHERKPFVPAAAGDGGGASTLHFPEMLHHQQQQQQPGEGSSSTGGPHQTLTFMWE